MREVQLGDIYKHKTLSGPWIYIAGAELPDDEVMYFFLHDGKFPDEAALEKIYLQHRIKVQQVARNWVYFSNLNDMSAEEVKQAWEKRIKEINKERR